MTPFCADTTDKTSMTEMLLGDGFHPGGLALTHQLAIETLVGDHAKVLDIACGTGKSASYLAQRFGATVFALDRSVQAFMQQGYATPSDSTLTFVQGEAQHLPIASETIDVVFCECAMSTFNNRHLAITEIYRVLKPGGFIALSDIYLNENLPGALKRELGQWLYIDSSYNAVRSQQEISQHGFSQLKFYDVSKALLESVQTMNTHTNCEQSHYISNTPTLPKRLIQLTYDGSIGYYLLTARKPG